MYKHVRTTCNQCRLYVQWCAMVVRWSCDESAMVVRCKCDGRAKKTLFFRNLHHDFGNPASRIRLSKGEHVGVELAQKGIVLNGLQECAD